MHQQLCTQESGVSDYVTTDNSLVCLQVWFKNRRAKCRQQQKQQQQQQDKAPRSKKPSGSPASNPPPGKSPSIATTPTPAAAVPATTPL